MLKIRLVSLLVFDNLMHAHPRSIIADPLIPPLFYSLHSLAIQEKHHFIIQIRLVLNCLKPRTEFKLETARSSPHDRWLLVLLQGYCEDRLFSDFSSSILCHFSPRPFMVEIYFRARRRFLHRIRHRTNTILPSHPPLLFFLSTTS